MSVNWEVSRNQDSLLLNVVLDEGAKIPERAHASDAGFDLFSRQDEIIKAKSFAIFDTGVHIDIKQGYVGFLKSKSGLNVKHSIVSEGVIDAGYLGSIVVKLYNHGTEDYQVNKGDKISQIVFLPIPNVSFNVKTNDSGLGSSSRGDNGFGSTGR